MARRQPNAAAVNARVALAKAQLATLAHDGASAPAWSDRLAAEVRVRPWRGVAVALGVGLAMGLSRGRGLRAVGVLAGPLGAALAAGALRQFGVGTPSPVSAVAAKIAETRARTAAR